MSHDPVSLWQPEHGGLQFYFLYIAELAVFSEGEPLHPHIDGGCTQG